ncbi:MAG: hypothetical protein INR73_12655 [Williamsia sp.]|nr:hypothetical protein [Williamsia sp.]
MKFSIKRLFKIVAWLIGILIFTWMLVWIYVLANKKSLINKVSTQLNSRIGGEIIITDFEPSLISTFPHVALRLNGFAIRDSMWKEHHHDLIKAEYAFVRLGLFSLFTGTPAIKKVIIRKGSVYVFSDTTGYTNTYMFKSHDSSAKAGSRPFSVPDVEMDDVRLTLDLKAKSKLYDFDIHRLNCNASDKTDRLQLDVRTDLLVHSLAFNTDSGSFVREKTIEGNFTVDFYQSKKKLEFKEAKLQIDNHPFTISGMFDLSDAPPLYFLSIKTEKLPYKQALGLLSQNLGRKLARFNVEKPVDVQAVLDGTVRPNKIPTVKLAVQVKNNTVSTPTLTITDASFSAQFNNRLDPQQRPVNNNSGFSFSQFSGTWENIPVQSKQITLVDLDHPVINCDIQSSIDLKALNNVLSSNTVEFTKGSGAVNATYRGPVMEGDTAAVSIHGSIDLKEADLVYTPRNLPFTNSSGSIQFDDKDVYVKNLKTSAANSPLVMNGSIKNFISLINKSPEKINLDWNISSSRLNLGDFLAYLEKRSVRSRSKKNISALIRQIDRMLEDCAVDLQLNADRLLYKKFDASHVAANIQLTNNLIALRKVVVQHAGGTLVLNGSLTEHPAGNLLSLTTDMNNVNVPLIFKAFDNFGQDGITDKNLKGKLDADVKITGLITQRAGLADNTLKGIVNFNLKNGELIDFEPIEKISAAALNNKGVSTVKFADLKNKLDINGSAIRLNRMEIRSSVFTMFVEGLYDLKKGTDLSIQVPLNNLTKSKEDFTLKNKGTKSKTGVSVWLRAKTGDNGRAKISWDPFKRGIKERRKNSADSTIQAAPDSTKLERKQ